MQNQALHIIRGLRRTTPIPSMLIETNLPLIRKLINFILCKTILKICSFLASHMSRSLYNNCLNVINSYNWNVLPNKASFMVRALKALKTINFKGIPMYGVRKTVLFVYWLIIFPTSLFVIVLFYR